MDFGSEFLFAPTSTKEEYELIPESTYNHVVTGYASSRSDYKDDGEVAIFTATIIVLLMSSFNLDLPTGYFGHSRTGGIFSYARSGSHFLCLFLFQPLLLIINFWYSMFTKATASCSSIPSTAEVHLKRPGKCIPGSHKSEIKKCQW